MKNNITELVCILDRSGSMAGLESDTVGGFNALLEKQRKQEGTCYVSTILFSNDSTVLHDRLPLDAVRPLTDSDYTPGGCTALLDAIGGAIRHIGTIHRYARPEDVPEHTVFVITTDGMENASRRFRAEEVKRMIEAQKAEKGWEFLFLAANIDAVETAARIGIARDRAANYRSDGKGTGLMYSVAAEAVGAIRRCAAVPGNWADKLKETLNNSPRTSWR